MTITWKSLSDIFSDFVTLFLCLVVGMFVIFLLFRFELGRTCVHLCVIRLLNHCN